MSLVVAALELTNILNLTHLLKDKDFSCIASLNQGQPQYKYTNILNTATWLGLACKTISYCCMLPTLFCIY